MRRLGRLLACCAALALAGCGSQTVLSANFDGQLLGQPAFQQQVGTFRLGVLGVVFGSAEVVRSPVAGDVGHWLQLTQFKEQVVRTRYQGTFKRFLGDGRYLATFIFFIPEGNSAKITLDTRAGDAFLQIPFPPSGRMHRPSPSAVAWGRFPHDRRFSVAVSLRAAETSFVTINMLGAAEGSLEMELSPGTTPFAREFARVSLETSGGEKSERFLLKSLAVVHSPP